MKQVQEQRWKHQGLISTCQGKCGHELGLIQALSPLVKRRYSNSRGLGDDNPQHTYLSGHHSSGLVVLRVCCVTSFWRLPSYCLSLGEFCSQWFLEQGWLAKEFLVKRMIFKFLRHTQFLVFIFQKTKPMSYFLPLVTL